jgi:type I restriction enzyme R subunit
MLEAVRRRLRALIKLIELKRRLIVCSDFEDQIGQGTAIELSGVPPGSIVRPRQ